MRFIKTHKAFCIFLILALTIVLVAVLAPVLAPRDPLQAILSDTLKPPCEQYPWGADKLGRDVLSRVLFGARTSLTMTFSLVGFLFVFGTALGIISGWCGGLVDGIVMRIADIMLAFPGILLAVAIAGLLGASSINAVFALAAVTWPKYARLSRSLTLKIKHADYIAGARVVGTPTYRILWRYVLPELLPTMLVTVGMDIGTMMLELAGLSFLGFGAKPPIPEWGAMLSEGRSYMRQAPWLMIYPGLAIFIVVVIFNLLGDSIRDWLEPRRPLDKDNQ